MNRCDVLVVGAGPTGLTLACLLRRAGVDVRVVDAAPGPATQGRAVALHARTLELLEPLGVTPQLLARGVPVHGARIQAGAAPIARIAFDDLPTRHPYVTCLPQADTEAALRDALAGAGVALAWRHEVVDLQQDEEGVTVAFAGGHAERARYVVGCDGAHSAVARAAGLAPAEGGDPETVWLADVVADPEPDRDWFHVAVSDAGTVVLYPLPDARWRLVADAPDGHAAAPTADDVATLLALHGPPHVRATSVPWTSRYRVRRHLVDRYADRRVLLAGDAAHVHAPLTGQGLNAGVLDASNLAWKLALAVRGRAAPDLLDSYDAEQRAVARRLQRSTDLATRVANLRTPLARALRRRVGTWLASLEPVQHRIARTAAELAVDHRRSAWVAEQQTSVLDARFGDPLISDEPEYLDWRAFRSGPRAGRRAPDAVALDAATGRPVHLVNLVPPAGLLVLLFDGRACTAEGYARIAHARAALAGWGDVVRVRVVVPGATVPEALGDIDGVLFDPEGHLELAYGAPAECAYVIRPDQHVAFRSQPIDADALVALLGRTLAAPTGTA